eukprot:846896-Prymnesium_polylepis.1
MYVSHFVPRAKARGVATSRVARLNPESGAACGWVVPEGAGRPACGLRRPAGTAEGRRRRRTDGDSDGNAVAFRS